MTYPFLKGHGTENDFVLLPDPDGTVHGDLAPDAGARAVRPARRASAPTACCGWSGPTSTTRRAGRGEAEWFMDYRNADGSVSEMCGNGIRVFGRYLAEHEGLVAAPAAGRSPPATASRC